MTRAPRLVAGLKGTVEKASAAAVEVAAAAPVAGAVAVAAADKLARKFSTSSFKMSDSEVNISFEDIILLVEILLMFVSVMTLTGPVWPPLDQYFLDADPLRPL